MTKEEVLKILKESLRVGVRVETHGARVKVGVRLFVTDGDQQTIVDIDEDSDRIIIEKD